MVHNSDAPPTHYLDWVRRGHTSAWRYVLVILGGYFAGMFGIIPEVLLMPGMFGDPFINPVAIQWTFLPGLVAILLLGRLLLGRPAFSLFSPAWPLRFADYGLGVVVGFAFPLIVLALQAGSLSHNYVGFGGYQRLGGALIFALVAGFVVQTAFEEILYRGAIMQLGWKIKAWIVFALPFQALLFAVPHFGNVAAWAGLGVVAILPYFLMALAWGWIAWRTGSLLAGMGLHFANNVVALLIVGNKGDALKSYAPILVDVSAPGEALFGALIHSAASIAAIEAWLWWTGQRRAAARKD